MAGRLSYLPTLIGGPLHGQRQVIEGNPTHWTSPDDGPYMQRGRYVRQYFVGPYQADMVYFYAHHSLVGRTAIELAFKWMVEQQCYTPS